MAERSEDVRLGSALNSLTPAERQALRALARHGRIKETATALDCNVETLRSHLKSARRKIGISDSLHAAAALIAQEKGHPIEGTPDWVIDRMSADRSIRVIAEDQQQVVRDSVGLDYRSSAVGPEPRNSVRGLREVLDDSAIRAVAFAALVALIIFGLSRLPDAISNRTFEPIPAGQPAAPE